MLTETTVKRTIKEGMRARIHPSYVFAGIQKRDIYIVGIYEPKDDESIKGLREARKNEIEVFTDLVKNEDGTLDKQDAKYVTVLKNGLWVGYAYTRGQEKDVQYLPIDMFIDHITTP